MMGVFVESLCILSTDDVDIVFVARLFAGDLVGGPSIVIDRRHLCQVVFGGIDRDGSGKKERKEREEGNFSSVQLYGRRASYAEWI
jgi:hypothetical protein